MYSTVRRCTMALASGVVAATLLAMPVTSVQAQSSSAPSNKVGPSTAPANIPDSKLDAAATAAKNAADIKDDFDRKLAQAPVADKVRIAVEADDAMVKAVTDQGLSLDEFKAIMRLAQYDPVVRDRFLERLR